MNAVVIGIGNRFRCDDGLGPAVAERFGALTRPGVRVVPEVTECTALLDAWAGASLAVVVDAAVGGRPGRVRRWSLDQLTGPVVLSSHDLDLQQTFELGRALGCAPEKVVVVTVGAVRTGHGEGLSPAVLAALPEAVRLVETVLAEHAQETADQVS